MKLTNIFLTAGIAGMTALFSSSALATTDAITVTATIELQNTNKTSGKTTEVSQRTAVTWTTAKLYSLITNAVANLGTNGPGIASTNLPSNGYIAFNPTGTDGNIHGTFYVTNKTGFSYPLSGVDTNGNYYSFMELDAYLATTDNTSTNGTAGLVNFGFSDNFNGVETGSYNSANGGGSESAVSTALFYIHDNPFAYNGGNNPNAYFGNDNAFEIRGVADITLSYKASDVLHWSISLQGTGNAIVASSQNAVTTSGHFSVSQ